MEQSQAQRRLVKSAPELWAQVSSEDALGRCLAPFGEIRITRVEPETTVAWEGERASGTVELAPAGWGTQVVLTATLAERPSVPMVAATPAAGAVPQPAAVAARRQPVPAPTAVRPPPPRPDAPATRPAPKLGFFARLFRRRRQAPPPVAAPPRSTAPVAASPRSTAPEPARGHVGERLDVPPAVCRTSPAAASDLSPPAPGPEPPPPDPDPAPTVPEPLAAPIAWAALDAERAVAILTGVLDDLGAAHHRSSRTTDLFSPT